MASYFFSSVSAADVPEDFDDDDAAAGASIEERDDLPEILAASASADRAFFFASSTFAKYAIAACWPFSQAPAVAATSDVPVAAADFLTSEKTAFMTVPVCIASISGTVVMLERVSFTPSKSRDLTAEPSSTSLWAVLPMRSPR